MHSGASRPSAVLVVGLVLQMFCSESAHAVLPNFTAITPNNGVAGDTITVTGHNFTLNPYGPSLRFSHVANTTGLATVISWDATHIVATVPGGAATGPITVNAAGGSATSSFSFQVNSPRIDSFSPGADVPGATVTVNGGNFSQVAGENIVRINNNNNPATNVAVTCTFPPPPPATQTPPDCYKLTAKVNATATTGKITIKVGSNYTATSLTDFIVAPRPVISNVSATLGPVGLAVTITGSNFAATSPATTETVTFNGTAAVVSASSTAATIYTNVPAGANTGAIVVKINASGAASENNPTFTVVPLASITSISPATAPAGADVMITGQNFAPTAAGNTVTFNGVPAVIKPTSTSTTLVATVPSQTTSGPVGVTAFGFAATNTVNFGLMRIVGFAPPSATAGTVVTISGENFGPAPASDTVKFNGVPAAVGAGSNSSTIYATVPSGATIGPISVTVNGYTTTSTALFSFLNNMTGAPATLQYGDDGRLRKATTGP